MNLIKSEKKNLSDKKTLKLATRIIDCCDILFQDFLARMIAAEEQKTNVLKDLSRRIFEKFSTNYNQWEMAVKCIATLDILLSFAEFARQQIGDVCLPEVTFEKGQEVSLVYC